MKKLYYLLVLFLLAGFSTVWGQNVIDPNDPIVEYNSSAPPARPQWGQVGKWVRTKTVSWNTNSFKAYIYKDMPFRLKFPKSYDPSNPNKKYPLLLVFHTVAEYGTVYNNEKQLNEAGQWHMDAADAGKFDGFLLFPQSQNSFFGPSQYDIIASFISDVLFPQANVDPYRVLISGFSGGGQAAWNFTIAYPKLAAATTPLSAASFDYKKSIETLKWMPIWWFQGAKDPNPPPTIARDVAKAMEDAGANIKLNVYDNYFHQIFAAVRQEQDLFPFYLRANKANPWPLFGKAEFCPGETVSAVLGLTPGFDGYEWRKDGQLIPGANTNSITATEFGTYDARIKRGNEWSSWSPTPVQVKAKAPTVSPTISANGLSSIVLPTPAGADTVVLSVPDNFYTYEWTNTATNAVVGNSAQVTIRQPGQYAVKMAEKFGCASDISAPFKVAAANGTPAPDAASSLIASAVSKEAIALNWSDKANPTVNETGFEVYRATSAGGPYTLVAKVGADILTYTSTGLNPNTVYYYIIRAVNDNGAAPVSNEASARTQADTQAPTAPGNLKAASTSTPNSILLTWTPSKDDVGVYQYDIYINGDKAYTISGDKQSFTAYGLDYKQTNVFTIKARDLAGNVSPASNQAVAGNGGGFTYKYYEGSWSTLPDFSKLTPVKTGITARPDITLRNKETNYGFLWEGFIRIPAAGSYTFETYSDDGSKLYIGGYSPSATALVDNDGAHSAQYKEGTLTLEAGVYPIAVTYFQSGGGQDMKIYWKNTANGVTDRQEIPSEFFTGVQPAAANTPNIPTGIKATAQSYKKINVSWTDNSNNETGFEVYRTTDPLGNYEIVGSTAANITSFTDSLVTAQTTYHYKVKAVNSNGDKGFSMTEFTGLQYDYYEQSSFTAIPDFSTLKPVKSGVADKFSLVLRNRESQYAVRYIGAINIPTTGSYTFYVSADDGAKLYIDGLAESNVLVTTTWQQGERSASKTLSAGRHIIQLAYYAAGTPNSLTVRYAGPNITKQEIPVTAFQYSANQATTPAVPDAPVAPANVSTTDVSTNKIGLQWAGDNTATNFEIFRASSETSPYVLLTTVPANGTTTAAYTDSLLPANTTYYYKVRARNDGGPSTYSNAVNATTLNTAPVLNEISGFTMRYGTQKVIALTATDADGDALTLSASRLPAFAAFTDNGNGTGTITFSPGATDLGTYADIEIKAADGHNGVATRTFTVKVDDNFQPVLGSIQNVSLAEKTQTQITLSAQDANATDQLTWSASGLPAFATLTGDGNNATINVQPGYGAFGIYNVKVKVDDGRGGIDEKSFTLSVTKVDPNFKVYIDFNDGATPSTAPWNNTNKKPALNDVFTDFKDTNGKNSGIGMKVLTAWQNVNGGLNTNNQGYSTWQNVGLYPDAVMQSSWWSNNTQTFRLTNLPANFKYSFTFYGSRTGITDARVSAYTINGTSVTLNATNNQSNTISLNNVFPDAGGNITIDLSPAPGNSFAYINAMIVNATYDDKVAPVKPTQLNARILQTGIRLRWNDQAYNEDAYEVYRAAEKAGPYTLLNPSAANANDTAYTDAAVSANKTYFYAVKALNTYGATWSDTIAVTVPNIAPVLTTVTNVSMRTDAVQQIAIKATDDPADVITLSVSGLPSFATFTDNGGGNGSISLSPRSAHIGSYTITVKAADDKGGSSTQTFTVLVTDKTLTSIYVNCNEVLPVGAPWNSFNAWPNAGVSIANLKDESNTATGISITLLDSFSGANNVGATTGNNSGVYPDDVMKTFFYDQNSTPRRVRLSNVPAGRKYNLVFFGSREAVSDNRNTIYEAGGQSVTLNAASNTTKTVQINGLSPDANGNIEFTLKQASGAFAAYLNTLVIQSYVDNGIPLSPANLTASAAARSTIQLAWADKSSNETGFELYRATQRDGAYKLISTLPANTTTFKDGNLPDNALYYYKVRAVAGTQASDYSNIAAAGTMAYGVYFNFNSVNPAPAPWNSTNALPYDGQLLDNIKDDNGNTTGIVLNFDERFSGANPAGAQTGNNTGVFPDIVMAESYYLDLGFTAKLRLSGLDQSKEYTFTFFGSRASGGTRVTGYTINGRMVSLDANDNTQNTVQLERIRPDENGEIRILVSVVSNFGYLNAMVMKAYPADKSAPPAAPVASQQLNNNKLMVTPTKPSGVTPVQVKKEEQTEETLTVTNVYPNPLQSFVNVSLQQHKDNARVMLKLIDMNGRLIQLKDLGARSRGIYLERLDINNTIGTGIYLLQITVDNQPVKTIKLIKH
ncbi:T9SS type A sorting domain-containing protein [Chitinophaga pendula]|uniref:fibronectin type III domain-containing protein n=1 Tax=Chitinophaga pendula TaxID=2849666 RepID=UPI001CEDE5A7|nr:PA14 domain-containing protein [Chitinophaga pendula]UCJ09205.1 T9SS type A sorting domain-containing protein [Chitinophaga pendula]